MRSATIPVSGDTANIPRVCAEMITPTAARP